jgi:hypothetical protein
MNSERLRKYRKELSARIIILRRQKYAIEKATRVLKVRAKRLAAMAERYANATGNNNPEREVARLLGNRNRNRNFNNYL